MTVFLAARQAGVFRPGGVFAAAGPQRLPLAAADWRNGIAQPGVSVSRASGGTAVFGGVLTEYGADTQRVGDDGLLIEPSRTNGVRNPRAEGAVVGVVGAGGALPTHWHIHLSGGLTTEVVALLSGSGFTGVRIRLSGTASGGNWSMEFETTTPAAPDQTWSGRVFHRLHDAPSPPVDYRGRISGRDSGGSTVAGNAFAPFIPSPTGTLAPVSWSATLTSDATIARVSTGYRASLTVGASYDFTVDLCCPQAEQAADSTTAILPPPLTLAASTRATESATMAVPGPDRNVRLLVQDTGGAEWRTVAVAGGAIPLDPRSGQRAIRRARVWEVGALTPTEEAALAVPA